VPNERKRENKNAKKYPVVLLTREINRNFFVLSRFPLETDKILQSHDQTLLMDIKNIIFFIRRLFLFSLGYALLFIELRLYCLLLHASLYLRSFNRNSEKVFYLFFFEFLFKKIIKKVSFFRIALRGGGRHTLLTLTLSLYYYLLISYCSVLAT